MAYPSSSIGRNYRNTHISVTFLVTTDTQNVYYGPLSAVTHLVRRPQAYNVVPKGKQVTL